MDIKVVNKRKVNIKVNYDNLNYHDLWPLFCFYNKLYMIEDIIINYQTTEDERELGYEREGNSYSYMLLPSIHNKNINLYDNKWNIILDHLREFYEIRIMSSMDIILSNPSNLYVKKYKFKK
jgi:hypothetical protein